MAHSGAHTIGETKVNDTQYELIEAAPECAEAVARLWSWSENYNYPTPASLFLDLIGWSDENLGEPLFDLRQVPNRLGYLELMMLAEALQEYSARPQDVNDYVTKLLEADND
jgi:hypothetical protein